MINFGEGLGGILVGFALCFIVFAIYLGISSETAFTKQCSSDNGVAIYTSTGEYCIKRSAFVEIER